MKNKYNLLLSLMVFLFSACSTKDEVNIPSDVTNLRAEARAGSIMLRWDNPSDLNFLYVPVQFKNPLTGAIIKTNVSYLTDSLLIDDILAKDGEYTFEIYTVGEGGERGGNTLQVSCTALPRTPVVTEHAEKIDFQVSALSANASDPTEGNLANLIDGDLKTHYHTNWHEKIPFPQWIQFDLKEPVEGVKFVSWNRNGSNNANAEEVYITGSNDGENWVEIGRILPDELPTTGGAKFESKMFYKQDMTFTKIRYNAKSGVGGKAWFSIAELEWYKTWVVVVDPERN
ncbi:hypothetical protein KO02_09065 [Sphingobacterium sp. ML3W]|uniref:discoidin domain-containing protein n=1 Tax=Sphingobacterium sp. ML3W TaxID=1538644 RepID=UPI0004F65E52|nr:discoidin domain-containing protein [Sphingobacterium sp. ML3W]AIM36834.1 hypothetical protein KO02_09065 [Sphingobacterium sp. ML3W]